MLPLPLAAAALSPSASYACVLPITETRFSSGGVVIRCVLPPFRQLRSLNRGGSVAEWLARWTQIAGFKSQPRRCRLTVLGKLFTPIVPLFTNQRNW